MNLETPQISNCNYTYTTTNNADFNLAAAQGITSALGLGEPKRREVFDLQTSSAFKSHHKKETMKGRIVRVFITDSNENVPLDKCFIHKSEEITTELSDQELYFDIDLKERLKEYNAYRVTVKDKKLSEKMGKEVLLEPVRIRDLNMVVVEIAKF